MRITDIIWKERTVAKLADKHSVSVTEAEEVLLSRPVVRRMAKGHVRGEDVYAALAQVRNGRYLIVFFIDKKRRRGAADLGTRHGAFGEEVLCQTHIGRLTLCQTSSGRKTRPLNFGTRTA